MRARSIVLALCVIGLVALFSWYVGFYQRPTVSQAPALSSPGSFTTPSTTALAAPSASRPTAPCSRETTDNGMIRLSLHSVSTAKQLGFWGLGPESRFLVVEIALEAITDFQLASSAVLWLEEPDGTERSRSVAMGALARPLESLSPARGERVRGQVVFEISAQTKEFKLHYDPFLARQLTLCAAVP